jgi:ankyrin repeat protein
VCQYIVFAAAQCGHLQASAVLLEYGANTMLRDSCGKVPLHCCCEGGHFLLVQLLVEKGNKKQFTEVDIQGRTPLHLALYALQKIFVNCGRTLQQQLNARAKIKVSNLQSIVEMLFPLSDIHHLDSFGYSAEKLDMAIR